MKLISKFLAEYWGLILLLVIGIIVLLPRMDKPFWGHHDWNGVYWGNVARNYDRYGQTTKLAMVENVGLSSPDKFQFTFHYSPLYPLLEGGVFHLFGVRESSARGLSAVFSLSTLLIWFLIVRALFSQRVALAALGFWIATPMFIYFAKLPVHEPVVLFFALLTAYGYFTNRFRLTLLSIILAELTSWPGYFLVPALTAFWWLTPNNNRPRFKIILRSWAASLLVFGSLLLHDFLVTGSMLGGGLGEIFFQRISPVPAGPFITTLSRWVWTYYSLLVPLTIIGLLFLLARRYPGPRILIFFLLFASGYPLIFRDASFRHDYLLIYFLPFFSLGAAVGLSRLLPQRYYFALACGLVVALMIVLRGRFTVALLNSDIYRQSVLLGKYIRAHSRPPEKIGVWLADPNTGFDGWFISFYADRSLTVSRNVLTPGKEYSRVFVYRPDGIVEELRLD